VSAVSNLIRDLRIAIDKMNPSDAMELDVVLEEYESAVLAEDAERSTPLASTSGDVNAAREHMRWHVEDLEHLPEWLRPELRVLLHEGRLT